MRWAQAFFVLIALILGVPEGHAEPVDHAKVREAVKNGEIQSVRSVLRAVEKQHPEARGGKMIDVAVDLGRRLYRIKMLASSGHVLDLEVDAKTGKVRKIRSSAK